MYIFLEHGKNIKRTDSYIFLDSIEFQHLESCMINMTYDVINK